MAFDVSGNANRFLECSFNPVTGTTATGVFRGHSNGNLMEHCWFETMTVPILHLIDTADSTALVCNYKENYGLTYSRSAAYTAPTSLVHDYEANGTTQVYPQRIIFTALNTSYQENLDIVDNGSGIGLMIREYTVNQRVTQQLAMLATCDSASATAISRALNDQGGLAIVSGTKTTSTNVRFSDIVHVGASVATAISSIDLVNPAAVRTYTVAGSILKLQMASDTYKVHCFILESFQPQW
jgi:hypothetical protein